MKLYLLRISPVQEIAAEPATLEFLKAALLRSPSAIDLNALPGTRPIWDPCGLGLVADPSIRPGFVHLRPIRQESAT